MNAYNAKLRAYLAANRYMDTLAFHSISGRDLKNSAIADVPSDLRRRGEMEHVGVVSAALKTALAGALLLGAATLAASDDRKAVRHPTGHAETRGTRTIPASKNSSRSNELATRPTPSDVGGRPAYAPPNECWTDDGGFRWRPCTAGGGGGM